MSDRRIYAPCCGQDMDYCECSWSQREYALVLERAREECPPAPALPADHPALGDGPPF